jgi:hypothetical protein
VGGEGAEKGDGGGSGLGEHGKVVTDLKPDLTTILFTLTELLTQSRPATIPSGDGGANGARRSAWMKSTPRASSSNSHSD